MKIKNSVYLLIFFPLPTAVYSPSNASAQHTTVTTPSPSSSGSNSGSRIAAGLANKLTPAESSCAAAPNHTSSEWDIACDEFEKLFPAKYIIRLPEAPPSNFNPLPAPLLPPPAVLMAQVPPQIPIACNHNPDFDAPAILTPEMAKAMAESLPEMKKILAEIVAANPNLHPAPPLSPVPGQVQIQQPNGAAKTDG